MIPKHDPILIVLAVASAFHLQASAQIAPSGLLRFTDFNGDGRADVGLTRPGSNWQTVPVLFATGGGHWNSTNNPDPGFANLHGAVPVAGDYDGDGRTDVAFIRPGSDWHTVPILFATGSGNWSATNNPEPGFANLQDVIPIPGDYNGDGRTDIAFTRPGSNWQTVPILFATGSGTWNPTNNPEPGFANEQGVVHVAGDYDGDGRTDIAFVRPGSDWHTVPILFATGSGNWSATNNLEPGFANLQDVIPIPGDYNGDGRTDIAFTRPGSNWQTVPILFATGSGTWNPTNNPEPGFANEQGVVHVAGDYDGDGRTDIAFVRPGSDWHTAPILFATGSGNWSATNNPEPGFANLQDVVPMPGDYNGDGKIDIAFVRPGSNWHTVPILFATGSGSWNPTNNPEPGFANILGIVPIAHLSAPAVTQGPTPTIRDLRGAWGNALNDQLRYLTPSYLGVFRRNTVHTDRFEYHSSTDRVYFRVTVEWELRVWFGSSRITMTSEGWISLSNPSGSNGFRVGLVQSGSAGSWYYGVRPGIIQFFGVNAVAIRRS